MTALLGLLAVAGYQHRDKIAEMLGSIGQSTPAGTGQSTSGGAGQSVIGSLLGQLKKEPRRCRCRRASERRTW